MSFLTIYSIKVNRNTLVMKLRKWSNAPTFDVEKQKPEVKSAQIIFKMANAGELMEEGSISFHLDEDIEVFFSVLDENNEIDDQLKEFHSDVSFLKLKRCITQY